jgi:hypothetical protein
MLSMTDYPTPKFPATPEEVKAASEKVVNFWVGALSPMWVPFWAASSFGLSAWAVTQNLSKTEGLLKDMPQMADMAGKWPGFTGVWGAAAARAEAAEKAAEKTAEAVVEAVAVEPKVAFDPVIKAPVAVSEAAVEPPAVLKAAARKVEPKPIAKAVSAVKKPAKKT